MSGFLIVAVLLLAANYVPPVGAWLLLTVISSVAQLEFYAMANMAGIPVFRVVGTVCGAALISATFCTIGPDASDFARAYKWEQLVMMGSLIAIFVRQFPQKHNDKPLATIACTVLGIWYVPYLLNFFTRLAFAWSGAESTLTVSATGRMLIMYLIVVVKCTDIGAFFVGRRLGRHKLFPRISPAKTWEGLLGGLVTGTLASCLFCYFSNYRFGVVVLGPLDAIILGALLASAGTVGDLFESLVKRAAGTKDSGTLIPGMGGALDVMDSLIFGTPVLYVYAQLFLGNG